MLSVGSRSWEVPVRAAARHLARRCADPVAANRGDGDKGPPAYRGRLEQALQRQSLAPVLLGLDLTADSGFLVNGCSFRCWSIRYKHPLQEVDLQSMVADLVLQLVHLALFPASLPQAKKGIAGPWRNSFRQRCGIFGLTSKARVISATDARISSC